MGSQDEHWVGRDGWNMSEAGRALTGIIQSTQLVTTSAPLTTTPILACPCLAASCCFSGTPYENLVWDHISPLSHSQERFFFYHLNFFL